MTLTIVNVNGGERPWATWLGVEQVRIADIDEFVEEDCYRDGGLFLVLIHLGSLLRDGDATRVRHYDDLWSALPAGLRHNVWWIFYSGSGYGRLESANRHIHYLKYLIPNGQELPAEQMACFRKLAARLSQNEAEEATSLWSDLYPQSNRMAATLLTLLSAEGRVPTFGTVLQRIVADKTVVKQAHNEYASRVAHDGGGHAMSYEAWLQLLSSGQVAEVRTALERALGSVPD